MNVIFTTNVELWTSYWQEKKTTFRESYEFYILGKTSKGDFGLPFQLQLLQEHDLKGVFFVEPLFTYMYGEEPLQDIVSMIQKGSGEVQLLMHPEWNFLADKPFIQSACKSIYLKDYTEAEQNLFIQYAIERLKRNGGSDINGSRVASYGADSGTLQALAANGISFDASYNYSYQYSGDAQFRATPSVFPYKTEAGLSEYPVSIFSDRPFQYKHAQLCAISHRELTNLLWKGLENGWDNLVIVSQSFELMKRKSIGSSPRHDQFVTRRFIKLCEFLAKNRDVFRTVGFHGLPAPTEGISSAKTVHSSLMLTASRYAEQLIRRI